MSDALFVAIMAGMIFLAVAWFAIIATALARQSNVQSLVSKADTPDDAE